MSHLRLRRRVRLLVDCLSLPSIASSIALLLATLSAPSGMKLRAVLSGSGASVGGALVRHRAFYTSSPPPFWRTLLHRLRRLKRRRFAGFIVISVAVALEVWGCGLARDAGLPLDALASVDATPAALLSGQTLSFYDPTEVETKLLSSAAGRELRLLSPPPPNEARPSPWAIPESVYFIYRSGQTGSGRFGRQPLATAFVLSIPDRRQRGFVRFLVTARHVVDPRWAHCAESNPSSIDLRLNRRSGGVGYETLWLEPRGHRRFFTPSDPAADIAVMLLDQNLIPNLEEYKFIDVPFRMLPTDTETRQFRTSQAVITARAVARPSGDSGNFPVFDGGVLANMPAETVSVQCGTAPEQRAQAKSLYLWMINAGAPEDVSGAPVYAAIARGGEAGKSPVLLGVQSVAWPDQGVVGITPSVVLGELVQEALHGNRNQLDFYRGPAPVPRETSLY